MAEKPSSLGRKPLLEKSVNLHQALNATEVLSTSSRRWFLFRSRSSSVRKPATEIETYVATAQEKFVLVLMPVPNTSLTSFLTQVCGGPLESVAQFNSEAKPVVLLEFVHACHARRFQTYIRSGNCALNGRQLSVLDPSVKTLVKLVDKIRQTQPPRRESIPPFARRTLQLFIPIGLPSSNFKYKWEQRPPQLVRSRLDIRHLTDVFGKLGHVLQVRPMLFQRNIAFAVDFDCIASAVNAKTHFDAEKHYRGYNDEQFFPGLEEWYLEYARDSTERACLL